MLGFLGGRKTGTNQALSIINKAIDRDIQAQKTNLQNRRAGIGLQMNLLGRMQSMLDDERAAETATRLIANKTAQMKVEQTMAASASPLAKSQSDLLLAALNNQEIKDKAKLSEDLYNQRVLDKSAKYKVEAGKVAAQQKARAAQAAAMAKGAPPLMPPGMEILDPTRAMPTKDDLKRAKVMVGAQTNVNRMINDLLAWREQFGYEPLTGPQLAKANTLLGRVKSAMRKVDESGARLEEAEVEMMGLNFEMGDLGMIKERLTAVRDSVNNKVSDALMPMNIRLGSQPTAGARRRQ